jgi:hypothetical protein
MYYDQILRPLNDHKLQEAILAGTTFMTAITDTILKNLGDYHDTVREEAQLLLVSMTERFLPP